MGWLPTDPAAIWTITDVEAASGRHAVWSRRGTIRVAVVVARYRIGRCVAPGESAEQQGGDG